MKKFLFRAIGFTLLLAILCAIFFWKAGGKWVFLVIAPLFAALAVLEAAKMLNNAGKKNFPRMAAAAFYVMALSATEACCRNETAFSELSSMLTTLIAVVLAIFIVLLLWGAVGCAMLLRKKDELLEKLLNTGGIVLLFSPALLLFLASYFYEKGGYFLLFLCLVTKATDTGGYIMGSLTAKLPNGNHKIAPNVSPNKSWEGLIGGLVLSVGASALFYRFAPRPCFSWTSVLLCGLVLGLGSFFGDLAESALKRLCGVKDSGAWVPGMGGALDVLDSFLFNGTLFTVILLVIGCR